MPTLNEFYDQVVQTNLRLDQVHTDLERLHEDAEGVVGAVESVDATLRRGFTELIELGALTTRTLVHISQQTDAVICALENVSRNTCTTVNQGDRIARASAETAQAGVALRELFRLSHADAAVAFDGQVELRRRVEECCPPEEEPPPCTYERCQAPKSLSMPRKRSAPFG
jgi:hypothetical protein